MKTNTTDYSKVSSECDIVDIASGFTEIHPDCAFPFSVELLYLFLRFILVITD